MEQEEVKYGRNNVIVLLLFLLTATGVRLSLGLIGLLLIRAGYETSFKIALDRHIFLVEMG